MVHGRAYCLTGAWISDSKRKQYNVPSGLAKFCRKQIELCFETYMRVDSHSIVRTDRQQVVCVMPNTQNRLIELLFSFRLSLRIRTATHLEFSVFKKALESHSQSKSSKPGNLKLEVQKRKPFSLFNAHPARKHVARPHHVDSGGFSLSGYHLTEMELNPRIWSLLEVSKQI